MFTFSLLYPKNVDIESVVSLQLYISVHSLSVIWQGIKHAEFEIRNQGDLPINLKKFGCEAVDWTHLAQDESQ
jgi:hypothetical protein